MQLPAWSIHIIWSNCTVQCKELEAEFCRVAWINTGFRSGMEEFFNALVPEAPYHLYIVTLRDTIARRINGLTAC